VVGARPLFMTDYIACGKVVPERIATIVGGIAAACDATGTALVGGETAEHPGLLAPDDYDVAGAAVGAVEADAVLGPERVEHGDVVVAIASSGLHSNGFSLVRHILAERGVSYTETSTELGGVVGELLLEPTRLYTKPLLRVIDELPGSVHIIPPVRIDPKVSVGLNAKIGPNVYLESGASIGQDAVVWDSVVLRDASVQPGEVLHGLIVAKRARLSEAPLEQTPDAL